MVHQAAALVMSPDSSNTTQASKPLTKSALKKMEKAANIAASKAAKVVDRTPSLPTKDGAKRKAKLAAVVEEEMPFIEVPQGHKKG